MANISLTIKSDFAQAERDFRSLVGTSEDLRGKIEKLQSTFKTEQIDKFIAKNKLNAVAIQATQGPTASLAAETRGLQREIQRLINAGISPQDAELKRLTTTYNSLIAQQSRAQAVNQSGTSSLMNYAAATAAFYGAMRAGRTVWDSFIEPAMRAQEAASKFDTIFASQAPGVRAWADTLSVSIGRSSRELQGMAADMMAVLQPMPGIGAAATSMSERLVQVAQDISSFHDVDAREAFNAVRSGILGETEPLRRFSIDLTDASMKEYALAQGIRKRVEDMSSAEKAQLRYNIILARMGEASGDAERTSGSLTNKIRALEAALSDQSVALGSRVIPGMTTLVSAMTDATRNGGGFSEMLKTMADDVNVIIESIGNLVTLYNRLNGSSSPEWIKNINEGLSAMINILAPAKALWDYSTVVLSAFNNEMRSNAPSEMENKQRQLFTLSTQLTTVYGSMEIALRNTGDAGVQAFNRITRELNILKIEAAAAADPTGTLARIATVLRQGMTSTVAAGASTRQQLLEQRQKFDEEWLKKDAELAIAEEANGERRLAMRLDQLAREYKQTIDQAIRLGADLTAIDAYYSGQRVKVERDETQKRQREIVEYCRTMVSNMHSAFSDLLTTMQNFGHQAKALVITVKVLAMAEAAINSYLAFTQVLQDHTIWPTWARIPIASTILAAGLAKQAAIASTPISAETGITQYTVPEIRANRNDKAPVMASAGERVTIEPRGETADRTATYQFQVDSSTIWRVVQKGLDSGHVHVRVNPRNVGRSAFAS